jgi:AcrR family transcriptional regulator
LPEETPIIWMRPEKPARGPAPTYSRRQIAATAIKIADEDGLESLSMRRIAAELGTGAMTLYRYLPTKEDLYEVMLDEAYGEIEHRPPTGDVREDLRVLAHSRRALLLRHRWLMAVAIGRPGIGPNMARGNEKNLALVDGHELGIDDMFAVLALVQRWVTGFVQDEIAEAERARRSGLDLAGWQRQTGPYVLQLLETGEFPYLARVVAEAEHRPPDVQFEEGLAMILDGVETRLKK